MATPIKRKRSKKTLTQRLREITDIIEHTDYRCMSPDGTGKPTHIVISRKAMKAIYKLAKGRKG